MGLPSLGRFRELDLWEDRGACCKSFGEHFSSGACALARIADFQRAGTVKTACRKSGEHFLPRNAAEPRRQVRVILSVVVVQVQVT